MAQVKCNFLCACLQVISVEVPKNLELEVTQTLPGVKGNTVSGGTKAATLETGAVIQVCCLWPAHLLTHMQNCLLHSVRWTVPS